MCLMGEELRKAQRRKWLRVGLPLWLAFIYAVALMSADETAREQPANSPGLKIAAPQDVATAPPDAMTTASGLAMKILQPGSGTEHPVSDDCVTLAYTAWKRDGSLFSTSGPHGEPTRQCLTVSIPGIAEVLLEMVPGEKRRVWVPADLAFSSHIAHHGDKKMHEKPPPRVDLTVDVELVGILRAPPAPADLQTPPKTAFRTASGVALHVLREGTGAKHPVMASWVTLNYSGWTAGGTLFESTAMSGHPA